MATISVVRSPHPVRADPRRVVGRPYVPGEDSAAVGRPRLEALVGRILAIPQEEADRQLEDIRQRFSKRHRDLDRMLIRNSKRVSALLGDADAERCMLVGSYLTQEYAFEAAAVTNPSMVPAPDQSGLDAGAVRFVLSMRAVGEGHLSSVEFRTGVANADGSVDLHPVGEHTETGERRPPVYERRQFGAKLSELGADPHMTAAVLDQLARHFGRTELASAIKILDGEPRATIHETLKLIEWLASSNYLLDFDDHTTIDQRLLYPEGPFESRGMEDARFVHFAEDNGTSTYYATYTAFNGFEILPQLIETNDFKSFEITTMNGRAAQNKGIALFPRPINDRYVALSRPDRENIHILNSDNPRFWAGPSVPLRRPQQPWELVQMGNCGSPIETSEGWLVVTHGVGAMRTYRLGVMLLDLEHPERVIADLPDPILQADDSERDGYVPNVVYSCGAMRNGDHLVLPYGFADCATGIAVISVNELLGALKARPARDRDRRRHG